jgi:hypothetical protein
MPCFWIGLENYKRMFKPFAFFAFKITTNRLLLSGYPGSGVLIGLGIGFLATGLVPVVKKPPEGAAAQPGGMNMMMPLLGVFMILIGVGIVWAPAALWPYAIAAVLILLGIWFLIRGFYRSA